MSERGDPQAPSPEQQAKQSTSGLAPHASGVRQPEPLFFEDFARGYAYETHSRTVTEADVVAFASLSGDFNPLHTDTTFAKETIFGERIAHGLLGLAIGSGLTSRMGIIEGTVLAFLGMTWSFKQPIRIGDTISLRARVAEARETSRLDRGVVRFAVEIVNQRSEVVQEGEQVLMVQRRPQSS